MYFGRKKNLIKLFIFFGFSFAAFYFYDTTISPEQSKKPLVFKTQAPTITREVVSQALTPQIMNNRFPDQLDLELEGLTKPQTYSVKYTIQDELQNYANELLNRYRPDYGALVLMNARTGEILTMVSFEKGQIYNSNLALKATYPAASIFKVITAATAVDKAGVSPNHRIAFNGGNYTLYKKNVLSDRITRWTRFITLKEAFARSINTAFGRLSLEKLEPSDLHNYAERFMFNQDLNTDFHVDRSLASVPEEKGYELTAVAAGYNRFNTLSPVHGALIASTIINEGRMPRPYLVKSVLNQKNEIVYSGDSDHQLDIDRQVISSESAEKLKTMMEQTVLTGTSRKTFRHIVRDRQFREVEMGGKTGHFSGTDPVGRNDWFVGYASDGTDRIAVAAITVNIKKWTVKSSALGEMMFRKYFTDKIEEQRALRDSEAGMKYSKN